MPKNYVFGVVLILSQIQPQKVNLGILSQQRNNNQYYSSALQFFFSFFLFFFIGWWKGGRGGVSLNLYVKRVDLYCH